MRLVEFEAWPGRVFINPESVSMVFRYEDHQADATAIAFTGGGETIVKARMDEVVRLLTRRGSSMPTVDMRIMERGDGPNLHTDGT